MLNFVCSRCGSKDLRRNADCAWNVEKQEWEVVALFDDMTCEECGCECGCKAIDEEINS
jgi:hypothetical protein